jgi:hypothetical protein
MICQFIMFIGYLGLSDFTEPFHINAQFFHHICIFYIRNSWKYHDSSRPFLPLCLWYTFEAYLMVRNGEIIIFHAFLSRCQYFMITGFTFNAF